MSTQQMHPVTRTELMGLPVDIAPRLLGAQLETVIEGIQTRLRITEVEAYHGKGTGPVPDLGSHARMGPTARNATMWGEPGHLYVYLSHGIHSCVNVVCGREGEAGGVLLRAGEVIQGSDAAAARRGVALPLGRIARRDLARGPGRLGQAVGLQHALHNGIDIASGIEMNGVVARLELRDDPIDEVSAGPRVGVAGDAGTMSFPWRFWITGDATVSPFRWGRDAAAANALRG